MVIFYILCIFWPTCPPPGTLQLRNSALIDSCAPLNERLKNQCGRICGPSFLTHSATTGETRCGQCQQTMVYINFQELNQQSPHPKDAATLKPQGASTRSWQIFMHPELQPTTSQCFGLLQPRFLCGFSHILDSTPQPLASPKACKMMEV